MRLADLQARVLEALAAGAPGAGAAVPYDAALLARIRPDGPLDPAGRLDVYAGMYQTRLRDALREDYPRVEAALGDRPFTALVRRYVARHPSTRPSLRDLGRSLAAFLEADRPEAPWLADLARLEWARVEVFDAADAPPLTLDALRAVSAGNWPELRLVPVPSYRRLESPWPVHALWATPRRKPRRRATTIRVWREGFEVCHAAVGALERAALPLLEQGEPFARLCEAAEAALPAGGGTAEIGALLLRWVADGLLRRIG